MDGGRAERFCEEVSDEAFGCPYPAKSSLRLLARFSLYSGYASSVKIRNQIVMIEITVSGKRAREKGGPKLPYSYQALDYSRASEILKDLGVSQDLLDKFGSELDADAGSHNLVAFINKQRHYHHTNPLAQEADYEGVFSVAFGGSQPSTPPTDIDYKYADSYRSLSDDDEKKPELKTLQDAGRIYGYVPKDDSRDELGYYFKQRRIYKAKPQKVVASFE